MVVGATFSSPRPKRTASWPVSKTAERQQVAAVCYRTGNQGIEFLLVQSRGGRWIFPKGGVEAGLTQAQSAALEAFEEAGVHGRIEEMPFARYRQSKSASKGDERSREDRGMSRAHSVTAHLCEVSYLEAPQEANRKPTWFSPEKAKRRLLADRPAHYGEELAGIVDRAVSRIRRLEMTGGKEGKKDALQQVRFEAFEGLGRANQAAIIRALLQDRRAIRSLPRAELESFQRRVLAPRLQLVAGTRPARQSGKS